VPDILLTGNRDTWPQADVQFNDFPTAEQVAAVHLAPTMATATEHGLITRWWFIRKAPRWRVRYQPTSANTAPAARAFIHTACHELRSAGHISHWAEAIYEPEQHAFGGPVGMNIAHDLFHQDSEPFRVTVGHFG
jgi:thiopeptide-type bacteriocin biosynthesis protein